MTITDLLTLYEKTILSQHNAKEAAALEGRKEGGLLRSSKGKLVEKIAQGAIKIAWSQAGGDLNRLSFDDVKTFKIPLQPGYIEKLHPEVRDFINERIKEYKYNAKVDVKAFVDRKFVIAVECKSYTENAMLKRILIDFRMIRSLYPNVTCCLFQLESQLGGSYSFPGIDPQHGSSSSHTLMSFFPEVNLNIVTLLKGERKVNQPIHEPKYYKKLDPLHLGRAIDRLQQFLKPHI